ncbi:hypothetical protein OMW55_03935 [Sphingomonas sp. BN140010]|uniref:YtxH domain-containing protein n=1 Tax=Sphingomonas arvum TaxID=2992113 RepID=A0ABT3JD12_9SPHN|nr:hypothetical protein [Sphingomonas sp. BN140010]MCW3796955.1 hypothetical protein [Sphingomonas sp. BN140010]
MAKRNQTENFDSKTDYKATDYSSSSSSSSSGRFANLGSSASGQIDNSPLIALGAGAALGAVLGAVLPTSSKERELLQPLGSKLNTASSGAIERGREMAKQRFDEMAGDKVREFFGASGSSSSSSGSSNS